MKLTKISQSEMKIEFTQLNENLSFRESNIRIEPLQKLLKKTPKKRKLRVINWLSLSFTITK